MILLQENSIGQDFALYYLAYATYLELRGSFAQADSVFQEGLTRFGTDFVLKLMPGSVHVPARVSAFAFADWLIPLIV